MLEPRFFNFFFKNISRKTALNAFDPQGIHRRKSSFDDVSIYFISELNQLKRRVGGMIFGQKQCFCANKEIGMRPTLLEIIIKLERFRVTDIDQ